MYIRKEIKEFLKKMPKNMKKPKHWRKFVNENNVQYNLIIKHGKEYECTNCGKYFYKKQVEGMGYIDTCPFCNNQYKVRRSNLKNYFFLYDLAIIDNVDNKIVIRYFEVRREYNSKIRRFKDSVVEYARIIPELNIELVNDRFVKYLYIEKVYHTKRIKKWRIFRGYYGLSQRYKAVYLENLDEKLKGTIYQYALIKDAIKYLDNNNVNLLHILNKAKYPSFELLMKLGLYKLALDYPEKFNEKGCFEKRFGISKDYLKFMKRNNIAYDELQVLKLINKPNIKIIRHLLKIANSNIKDLNKVQKYIKLVKIDEYSKKQKHFSIINYLDYLRNMEKLEVPFTKNVLLPDDFHEAHNLSVDKVKIVNNEIIDKKMKERFEELYKNQYSNKLFFIRPAKDLNDMKDEAKQQNNCVYKNYSENYAFGDTDIYFMRKINSPEKSLVTVEVLDNRIRQKYQKDNELVTKEQNEFLKLWEEQIIQKAA